MLISSRNAVEFSLWTQSKTGCPNVNGQIKVYLSFYLDVETPCICMSILYVLGMGGFRAFFTTRVLSMPGF